MVTNDKIVENLNDNKKYKIESQRTRKGGGQITFLVPNKFDPKPFGQRLEAIGAKMKFRKKHRKNWKIVTLIKEHHN